jgi:hypothetical protein
MPPTFPLSVLPAAVAVLSLATGGARAETHLETFSSDPNPALWTLDAAGNSWGVTGGVLQFVRSTAGTASLVFGPLLQGDFDVRMDFDVAGWPWQYVGGERFGLAVQPVGPEPALASVIGMTQQKSMYAAPAGACCNFGSNAPLVDTGTVRLSRSGELLTLQYLQLGDWVTLGSTLEGRDMQLSLVSYFYQGFQPGVSYTVDQLSITAEHFSSPVPEPTGGAMLAAGLAALGWMARRPRVKR